MASIDRPHGTTLAALKGIAITASLLTAGELGTISLTLPSLYPAAQTSHRLAAQQFASLYRTAKATGPPVEIATTLICSALAYAGYTHNRSSVAWKLWAAAAGSMFYVIPWTIALMEAPSYKLLWVSEVASSATVTKLPAVKVTSAEKAAGGLGVPQGSAQRNGALTPMEEFEPFEDDMMTQTEYEQLKVMKLLKKYNSLNMVRVVGPLAAGVLGLWAALIE
ncbi:uncharacterized protein LTR77_007269 [Saxophila tyrrhenica]|uniref:DUF1772-domain-containing protein n=1 Tax=Saxophila tyrrhenica TaxID=1690608 RepID=A0AAV9P879_9PEZI|nr:hypothetical protein LTR77_007269 [Saxophila tyrrhenica]